MPPAQSSRAARDRLIAIIRARSFMTGTSMKLASGATTNYYFNMKPTMLDAEGGHLIATLLLDALADTNAEMIGGLEMGAVPLASCTAALSFTRGKPMRAFFVRKQAKEHGTQSLVEGLPKGETMAGRRVVVVEDVTTTGGSALKAVEALRAEGATVACVITIVDRKEGAAANFAKAGLEFRAVLTVDDFKG